LLRAFSQNDNVKRRGSLHSATLARVLGRRGRFDEAVGITPLVRDTENACVALEALCEVTAERRRWEDAPALVAAAREESEAGELLSLPCFADRLEGRFTAATGDATRAAELLRRSADGFAKLGARWEEAFSRLLLVEVLVAGDGLTAQRELGQAPAVFEQLRSVKEAERARTLLAAAPA
jgi:hypothetical protein